MPFGRLFRKMQKVGISRFFPTSAGKLKNRVDENLVYAGLRGRGVLSLSRARPGRAEASPGQPRRAQASPGQASPGQASWPAGWRVRPLCVRAPSHALLSSSLSASSLPLSLPLLWVSWLLPSTLLFLGCCLCLCCRWQYRCRCPCCRCHCRCRWR